MTDILMEYGLFLAKAVTVVVLAWIIIAMVVSMSQRRGRPPDRLEVKSLNEKYEQMSDILKEAMLSKKQFKRILKERKARRQAAEKRKQAGAARPRKRIFVLNFRGDIKATAVSSLREEVTAVLTMATPEDEVLLRLENAGGLVHEHGLAASQLQRIRSRQIPLTVAVDKVAASGGYLMACVGNRIIAAPFAVVGSIGVLAQLPNFHRFLDRHGVEFEQVNAGEHKKTLSMFGRNTDEERAKVKEQLEDLHGLFKDLVAQNRPGVDVGSVATGEYWYGARARKLNLIDDLTTSDDYLLAASQNTELYEVAYTIKKPMSERIASMVDMTAERLFYSWWRCAEESRWT
jgi:serine protease SohB